MPRDVALDVFEAVRVPFVALVAAGGLTALVLAAAVRKPSLALWGGFGVMALVAVTVFAEWRKPARLLLRLKPEGFLSYRRWHPSPSNLGRSFVEQAMLLPWSDFVSVRAETRTARFSDNTQERVLRLKVRPGHTVDRTWSHDDEDPDFLVQASGQSLSEATLYRLFEQGIRRGRLETTELSLPKRPR